MTFTQLSLRVNDLRSFKCALMFVLVLVLAASTRADQVRVREEKVGPITEVLVTLRAGETVTIETRNLSPDADPVLHLWDITNSVEIAVDDNSGGGKSARLSKVITRDDLYLLIVRPRNITSKGSADIVKNGVTLMRQAKFEGRYVFLPNLQAREQISVLPPPQGAAKHIMYVIAEDDLHIEARRGGGPRSQWEAPAGTFGVRTLLIGVRPEQAGKPMRLYRNDVKLPGADPDHDGLGTGLERQLKTCTVRSDSMGALPCDKVVDMRDTDGDGIADGWEVLGRDFSPTVYVALPTWGADPRHKDMFIEADYRRLNAAENARHKEVHMPAKVALAFAAVFGDVNTTDPRVRPAHAALVGNPDQKPGISTHIDTGIDPLMPEDAGKYGDWGGYDAIDAIPDADGNIVQRDPADLWKTHMHPSRRGIFRYGPGHESGGAQCGVGLIYCGYNFNDASNAMHEMMHSLGVEHSGPSGIETAGGNCKPNYPSVVNYGYQGDILAGSDNLVVAKGDLLSDGTDRKPLNNTALREFKALRTFNTTYIKDLEWRFLYLVDPVNGHVDWNRDGVFAPAGETVRAYANYRPGASCEGTNVNQVEFVGAEAASVALTQVKGHTLLFSVDTSGVLTMRDSTSDWQCAPAAKNCPGSSFGASKVIPFGVPLLAVDAEPFAINGQDEVSLVAIGRDGLIRERKFSLSSSGVPTLLPGAMVIQSIGPSAGEPSLAKTRDGRSLYLIYKGTDGVLRWRVRKGTFWGVETLALDSLGRRLLIAPDASPGIVSAYLPPTPTDARVYLAFSDRTRVLKLYALNTRDQWEASDLLTDAPADTIGRPSIAWVPNTNRSDTPGQLYMLFRDAAKAYKMNRTYFKLGSNTIRVGLTSYFDNEWLFGNAIDVTVGKTDGPPQMWATMTFRRDGKDLVLFRPRADGIVDIDQKNYDDWSAVAWGLCQTLVNSDTTFIDPVRCPKRPF